MSTPVYLASTNAHKLEELLALFDGNSPQGADFAIQLAPRPLDVEETGATFRANARLKAEAYAQAFGGLALADDSGLAVDALDGRPGVYSARYAPTDAERIARVLGELEQRPGAPRTAAFVCAMALVGPEGVIAEVEGRCEGVIAEAPRGDGGFGYDPVFFVPALDKTFAELTPAEKNAVSHRAVATRKLREALKAYRS